MIKNLTLSILLVTSVAAAEPVVKSRRPASTPPGTTSESAWSGTKPSSRAFELGLLVGGVTSEYVSTEFQGYKSQHPLGFTAGMSFLFFSGSQFSLDTGLYFSTPKMALGLENVGSVTIAYKAIELPLLLRWNLLDNFSLGFGGYAAQAVGNVSTKGLAASGSVTEDEESFEDAKIRRMDLGLAAGVQMRLPISESMRFLMDARYHHGMRNLNESTKSDPVFTRSLRLLVGAALAL